MMETLNLSSIHPPTSSSSSSSTSSSHSNKRSKMANQEMRPRPVGASFQQTQQFLLEQHQRHLQAVASRHDIIPQQPMSSTSKHDARESMKISQLDEHSMDVSQQHPGGESSGLKGESSQEDEEEGEDEDMEEKNYDDLESTLEGYFNYIGAKITDVANAGTAPRTGADKANKNTCEVCGKVNSSWIEMRKHMRSHADHKPYQCSLCPRSFHDMYKLKRHLVIHSGMKPYQCHICDTKLSRAEHLRRHLLVHKETKPFKCNLCEFSARRIDSVKSHQKSKHPGEWVQVVTIQSIVDIVTDETTITTNIVPNPKKKKKRKAHKMLDEPPTLVPLRPTEPSDEGIAKPVPTIEELSMISGLSLPILKAESTKVKDTTTSGSVSSPEPTSPTAATSDPSTSLSPSSSAHNAALMSLYAYPGSMRIMNPSLSPGVSSSSPSPSPRITESPSSRPSNTSPSHAGMASPPPKIHKPNPPQAPVSSLANHSIAYAQIPAGSSPLSVSVPSRPPLHPVLGMNPGSHQTGSPINYYPGLPGQFVGGPMSSPQPLSPYFTMKPVFPEAMPVNQQHHMAGMALPTSVSHHPQLFPGHLHSNMKHGEPLNFTQVNKHYNNNNTPTPRMGSPNS